MKITNHFPGTEVSFKWSQLYDTSIYITCDDGTAWSVSDGPNGGLVVLPFGDPKPAEPTVGKTPEQIAELKRQWLNDRCWDIEHTDGFEAHEAELTAWRAELEATEEASRAAYVAEVLARREASPVVWREAVLAAMSGGAGPRDAIEQADQFLRLYAVKWVP